MRAKNISECGIRKSANRRNRYKNKTHDEKHWMPDTITTERTTKIAVNKCTTSKDFVAQICNQCALRVALNVQQQEYQ